ncbi:MAG TPA: CHAT domain-containing protein [Pyrinomonadaceae bacterium]|nr:CHAT domain-containing protein [Pyrinomonadaceae bacterium]
MAFDRSPTRFFQASVRAALLTSVLLVNLHTTGNSNAADVARGFVKETGETHRLDLPAQQYVELRLHRQGDLVLTVSLTGPNGQKLIEMRTARYEDPVLRFITDAAGAYTLSIALAEKQSINTPYELKIESSRPATTEDFRLTKSDAAFREAERLRAQWNKEDLQAALGKYAEARDSLPTSSYRPEATIALLSIAEVHFVLSDYKEAIDYFAQARKNASSNNDRVREIQALNGIGYVHIYLSEYSQAIPYFNQALEIRKRVSELEPANTRQRLEATTLNNLGEAHYSLGDLKQSMDLFNRALALWLAAGDRRGQALAELNIGYVYYDMGDYETAAAHYEKSLPLWKATDELRGEALTKTALGGINSFTGERQLALDAHTEAMQVFQRIGDRQGLAAALNGLGRVYEESNDLKTALDNYEQALQLCQEIGHREFEALGELYLGRVYRSMKDPQSTLQHFERSVALSRASHNRRIQAYAEKGIAGVFDSQGRQVDALNLLNEVLSIYREIGDRRGQAQTLNNIGLIHQGARRFTLATTYFNRALVFNRAGDDRAGEAATRFNIARAERSLGSLNDALTEIREAMKIVESLRSSLARFELRYSYFALMQEYYAFYIDLLMQLYKQNSDQQLVATAFEASESTRARSLREILTEARVDIRQGVPDELLSRERELQQQLSARARYYLRLKNNQRTESEANELEKELRRLTNEYSEVEAQIRARSPRYAELTKPNLPDTKEIQTKLLDDQTVLLEYLLGEEKSYVWLVSNKSVQVYEILNRTELETATRKLYELLTARQAVPNEDAATYEKRVAAADAEYWNQATSLSRTLLGPLAAQISGKRLLLVTDGALQYLPFEALPEPESAEPRPLMLAHEIVNLPSASTLYSLRQQQSQTAAADKLVALFTDPVFGSTDPRVTQNTREAPTGNQDKAQQLSQAGISERDISAGNRASIPRLPSTRDEGEAIMRLVPRGQGMVASGFSANRSHVVDKDLGRFQIVHFATHGVVDTEHPELSGIILSMVNEQGSPEDGFFQIHDIYNLKLSARLVVLSACSTALGQNVRGEGFIGLTRAFMYAGAQSTVASLWKVDDNATTELMRQFYDAMLNQGVSPPAALRAAKEKMWQHPRWKHPFYWAAFVVQGEYAGTITREPDRSSKFAKIGALIGALILMAVGGLFLRRRLRRTNRTQTGELA